MRVRWHAPNYTQKAVIIWIFPSQTGCWSPFEARTHELLIWRGHSPLVSESSLEHTRQARTSLLWNCGLLGGSSTWQSLLVGGAAPENLWGQSTGEQTVGVLPQLCILQWLLGTNPQGHLGPLPTSTWGVPETLAPLALAEPLRRTLCLNRPSPPFALPAPFPTQSITYLESHAHTSPPAPHPGCTLPQP